MGGGVGAREQGIELAATAGARAPEGASARREVSSASGARASAAGAPPTYGGAAGRFSSYAGRKRSVVSGAQAVRDVSVSEA